MADTTISKARQFMSQVREYVLPPDATAEQIVRTWMDPLTRDTANKLPFFTLPYYEDTLREIGYMINGSTASGSQNYYSVFPFERILADNSIRLYIKAIQSVWSGTYIKTQSVNFSQRARVIVYNETPLDMFTLQMVMYNTLMTPWLDVYTRLLTDGMNIAAESNKALTLSVPKAFSESTLTRWDTIRCSIEGMTVPNKISDMAVVNLTLVVEDDPNTTVYNNYTASN